VGDTGAKISILSIFTIQKTVSILFKNIDVIDTRHVT
jgi:hypothetical protein